MGLLIGPAHVIQIFRAYAYYVFFFFSTVIIGVAGAPALVFGEDAARSAVRFWARTQLVGMRVFGGLRFRVEGVENIPRNGAVVAGNHQSTWETVALLAVLERPSMVFKQELLGMPIYRQWARRAGHISIDRAGGAKQLKALAREASAKIADGAQLVIFPEGTRSAPGERKPIRPGVAGVCTAAGAPCTPFAHDSGTYWRHPHVRMIPGEITLRFGPPIPAGIPSKVFLRSLQSEIDRLRPDLAETARQ